MKVVAIDPGPHTGFAYRSEENAEFETSTYTNETPNLWARLIEIRPDVIIIERFATGGKISRPGLDTVEIQGSVFTLAWMLKSALVLQTPVMRYPFMPDAKRLLRWPNKLITQHQLDALAHLLCFEARRSHGLEIKSAIPYGISPDDVGIELYVNNKINEL